MKQIEKNPRLSALFILNKILQKKHPLDFSFKKIIGQSVISQQDKNFIYNLVLITLRNLGLIDALLSQLLKKPIPEKYFNSLNILRLGACQLLFLSTPPYAAISTSLQLIDKIGEHGTKGMINAILRRLDREHIELIAKIDDIKTNIPSWLWNNWSKVYGEKICRKISKASLVEAPLNLTVRIDADFWAACLNAKITKTGSLQIQNPGPVSALPGYYQGAWWIQDAASSLPVKLFGNIRGLDVADICAAPGGKTAQLLVAGAKVTAVDHSKNRVAILFDNLHRLELKATVIETNAITWKPDKVFDAVLLDPPCSGTGTLRRHPDILRTRSPQDIKDLNKIQSKLLNNIAKLVRPGGILIYCVCSVQVEEGPIQVASFLERHSDYHLDKIRPNEIGGLSEAITSEGYLRTFPFYRGCEGGMDGFFAARLIRNPY